MRNYKLNKKFIIVCWMTMLCFTLSSCNVKNSDSDNENETTKVNKEDVFTERDLEQNVDLSESDSITVKDGENINITKEGIYEITGSAKNATVFVEAGDDDKVQLVLNNLSIENESAPVIYVKNADKVFVTSTDTESDLKVSGELKSDGDTNVDGVIFSKDDIVMNGTGTINITSSDNAISSKDELKITGGTLNINCTKSAIEANEGIYMADGTINVETCNDGLHAEDNDDDSLGSIYIAGGTLMIKANDDCIHATTTVTIDDGKMELTGSECIEGTYIVVNGGDINITSSDDGINASAKSKKYTPAFELNGGNVVITMGAGDTDGVDSNGDIYINGGTISITGQSTFDYDGNAEYKGGTIIENGTQTNQISNQMFGRGGGQKGMNRPEGNSDFDGNMGQRPEGEFKPEKRFNKDEDLNSNEGFVPKQELDPNNSEINEDKQI
ncbi:MAG: carbohydrate-binding domain-containing protein [Lachnospiraceae bacterium]|nr:carbohydrate-binding domain-containing protein [Lachnospiraceae bacterium]